MTGTTIEDQLPDEEVEDIEEKAEQATLEEKRRNTKYGDMVESSDE